MNKKILSLLLFATTLSVIAMAGTIQRVIVINNRPIDISLIDSITYEISGTTAVQKLWKDNTYTTSTLTDGSLSPVLSDMDLSTGMYRIAQPSEEWDLMYVTPIGYFFFCADANNVIEEDADSIGNPLWVYQSFDGLRNAQIMTAIDSWASYMDYENGIVHYDILDTDATITHISEEYEKESLCSDLVNQPSEWIASDELRNAIYHHVGYYTNYEYDAQEVELKQLMSDFNSILNLEVISIESDNPAKIKAKMAAQKIKKYHDRNFAVVPFTGSVHSHEIYDCSVRNVYGRISVASPNFLKEAEYGLLLDTNPGNLECDKAQVEIKLSQPSIMSQFSAYFNNLTSGTKYYYRTYCKIPHERLDTYHFRYGDKNATIGYGRIKNFTTKTGFLVKQEITNEGHRIFNDRESLAIPLYIYNIDYKWNSTEHKDEYNYSYSISRGDMETLGFYEPVFGNGTCYERDFTWPGFFNLTLSEESMAPNSAFNHGVYRLFKDLDFEMFFNADLHEDGNHKHIAGSYSSQAFERQYLRVELSSGILKPKYDNKWHRISESNDFYCIVFEERQRQGTFRCNGLTDYMTSGNGTYVLYSNYNGDITINTDGGALIWEEKDYDAGVVPEYIENMPNTLKIRTVFIGEAMRPSNIINQQKTKVNRPSAGAGSGRTSFQVGY